MAHDGSLRSLIVSKMSSYCVCAIVLWLVSLASFVECQTLYSNAEAREVPQIQALEKAVKRLEQENRALKGKWICLFWVLRHTKSK